MTAKLETLPQAFIWRRLHSLTGLWFVLFLMEHLLTNSQAALLFGESGKGFVHMVNTIHNLPYLQVIELTFLGIPFAIHMIWGVKYLLTGKFIHSKSDGTKPALNYGRNRAYTWQRITSWILLVLLIVHVVKFRFVEYPHVINLGSTPTYFVKVQMDPGLYTLTARLDAKMYDMRAIEQMRREMRAFHSEVALSQAAKEIYQKEDSNKYSQQDAIILQSSQSYKERQNLTEALISEKLRHNQVIVSSDNFGTASLFVVRNTFKSPFWVGLYTIFVLSACFHAFNGLWTSMITWGWVIKVSAQRGALRFAIGLMILVTFLGLAAVWGTYFINLKT